MLDHPEYLAISVLPDSVRQQVSNTLDSINHINLLSVNNNEDNINILSVDNIKDIINNQPDNSNLYPEFLEYVAWYERNLTTKLTDICPELSH
jgi:hypothetical protein